jgi:hypothetical protein
MTVNPGRRLDKKSIAMVLGERIFVRACHGVLQNETKAAGIDPLD